jgi:hypothetical protein
MERINGKAYRICVQNNINHVVVRENVWGKSANRDELWTMSHECSRLEYKLKCYKSISLRVFSTKSALLHMITSSVTCFHVS